MVNQLLTQEQKNGKLTLEESPYCYARTASMRALLIKEQDYKKILNMSIPEINNYLSEGQYRDAMTEMGKYYSGIALLEHGLNLHFRNTAEKLKRISPDSYNEVIDAYLLKYDVNNLKTIFRGIQAKLSHEEIKKLLLPVGKLSMNTFEHLLGKQNSKEIIKALPLHMRGKISGEQLIDIETSLDQYYYSSVLSFCDRLTEQGHLFKEFFLSIVEANDILTFLRLKKDGVKDIAPYLFLKKNRIISGLLKTNNLSEVSTILSNSEYKLPPLEESLIPIEMALEKIVFKKTTLFQHQNPLSVDVLLGYLFAKEVEIQNLRKIVKAKYLGVKMERVEEQLVMI